VSVCETYTAVPVVGGRYGGSHRYAVSPGSDPRTTGSPTALPRLYFCGQFVSPAGLLRQIGTEAAGMIASHLAPGPSQDGGR